MQIRGIICTGDRCVSVATMVYPNSHTTFRASSKDYKIIYRIVRDNKDYFTLTGLSNYRNEP